MAKPPPVPPPVPNSRRVRAFNAKLQAYYDEFAALEDHSIPAASNDRNEHHRRGPCYTLALALEKALADSDNPQFIRDNIDQTEFAALALRAIQTGF